MSSPEILKATLSDMAKESFSFSQAKQSTKCENFKNEEQIRKEKKYSSGYAFLKSAFSLTS